MNDDRLFTTSARAPAAASVVFIVLFGAMFALCLAGVLGLTPLHPPLALMVTAAAVFLALTAVFVGLLVNTVGNRLTVDAGGVHTVSRAGTIDRHTSARLELRLLRPAELEAEQPLLVRARIRGTLRDGATHQFALPSGRPISTSTAADYSPELQRILPVVAGSAVLPTEIRSAYTVLG